MNTLSVRIGALILPLILFNCGPFPDFRRLATSDIEPPVLLGAASTSSRTAILQFSEPVTPLDDGVSLTPTIQPTTIDCTDNTIILTFAEDLLPGRAYFVESTVSDPGGNQIKFITLFYGYNPRVPKVLINEFTTQGSTSHPDIVEILVLEAGNTAGLCVYEGIKENWSERYLLPSNEVAAGDFILVHFKPEGIAEELDEIEDPGASKGRDSSDTAWDYWVAGGNGLSGNNGVLSVYESPEGALIDGVLYSNRTSSSDETYRGFGTKNTMLRADGLHEAGGWVSKGEMPAPEDAVNPDDSTSTRSINRQNEGTDTNSKHDWHIVPTRGATFGGVNSNEVYE